MSLIPLPFQHHRRVWPELGAHPHESRAVSPEATDATPNGVVLVGGNRGLREEAASHLGTAARVITQVDHANQLTDVIGTRTPLRTLAGTAVVLITEPFLPGFATRLQRRRRTYSLLEEYCSLATAAHDLGADRLVVCSSAFLYADDGGRPLLVSSPIDLGAETVGAHAAEEAGRLFTSLGGCSVILRLGWVFGDHDPMTAKVVSAAQKGWQLIEGRPSSWVAAIASTDAARAIHAAFTAPPGTYNVSDGRPVTQGAIHAVLEQARGTVLHPLYDASWGESGTLFGASHLVADDHFGEVTGWQPTGTDLCHYLFMRVRQRNRSRDRLR
jgi:hypothetical protein